MLFRSRAKHAGRDGVVDLDGTALGVPVLRDDMPLPFQQGEVSAASVLPSFSVPLPRPPPGSLPHKQPTVRGGAGPNADETLFLKTPIEDETLPFLKADAALSGDGAREPPGGSPDLDGTAALPVLIEEAPALPFAQGAPSQVLAALPAAAATKEDPGSGTMLIPTLRDEDETGDEPGKGR